MEYVVIAVLIAAACVGAVFVFGRAVTRMLLTAGSGAALQHAEAKNAMDERVKNTEKDSQQAAAYHDSMHQ